MNWEARPQVKKGTFGEQIVDDRLRERGLIPYFPHYEGAHPFDRLCAKQNKKYLCIVEVKAKARRTHYPDTGINLKAYNEYLFLQNKYDIDVWLFFVDEAAGTIYGGKLHEISVDCFESYNNKTLKYPLRQTNKRGKEEIYFPLKKMKTIYTLSREEVAQLKQHSTRNYEYPVLDKRAKPW